MWSKCVFTKIAILISFVDSNPHELCKSENGSMTLSDKTDILSKFKNENGTETIFINANQELSLDEKFLFTCHKINNENDTKISIGSENVNSVPGQPNLAVIEIPILDLSINDFGTNTEPIYVKCGDVCEVIFIVVEFDASFLCHNENDTKNWDCGLDKLDDELAPVGHRSSDGSDVVENIKRNFRIKNPTSEEPAFLSCDGNDKANGSFFDIDFCLHELEKLQKKKIWYPKEIPYHALIEVQNREKRSVLFYMKKKYWPAESPVPNESLINPVLISTVCILVILVLIGATVYSYKKRRKRMLQKIKSDDKKDFDVFISYSNLDKEFVEDYLVPNLENESNEKKFHCLLHERDFVPGLPILDQIDEAVNKSSCTLIILSSNFVKSNWARQE